jgi:hypothetical protein
MGKAHPNTFSFDFNGSVRVETRDTNLSADAGVLMLRDLDERLGLVGPLADRLTDPRNEDGITHPLSELLRSRLFALVQGYTDQDDLDFLRNDPVFRLAVSDRKGTGPLDPPAVNAAGEVENVPDGLSSQPTQSRLIENLSRFGNLAVLNDAVFDWALAGFREQGLSGPVVLDIDSFPVMVYGSQPGSAYNGYYKIRCFHPLITMLAGTADILSAELRPGNVHTADGVLAHLRPVFERAKRDFGGVAALRGDAGFPEDDLLSFLETEEVPYAFRIKTNAVLERLAEPFLHRPAGPPPDEERVLFHEFSYAAEEWSKKRRIVLVVLEQPGDLYLDYFFLVTSWPLEKMSGAALLEFYRQRGTMEQHLGEIKSVLCPTLSSSPRPKSTFKGEPPQHPRSVPLDAAKANAATFLLYALAFNLMNIARNLLAQAQVEKNVPVPSLDTIRSRVLKTAARLTRSARSAVFTINEPCRHLWQLLLDRIATIRPRPLAAPPAETADILIT